MAIITLKPAPLTKQAFAVFGDVIEIEGATHFSINQGTIERFHDLANVDIGLEEQGRALISIARCNQTSSTPYKLAYVERHPLGSQAFIPLDTTPIIIAVALPGEDVDPADIKAFISNGRQGINYHRGVWHLPMIFTDPGQQMLIVDRGGPGNNCDEYYFPGDEMIILEF